MSNYYERVMKRLEEATENDIVINVGSPCVVNEIYCNNYIYSDGSRRIFIYFRGNEVPIREIPQTEAIYGKYRKKIDEFEKKRIEKRIEKIFEEL